MDPIKNGGFSIAMLVYQRVNLVFKAKIVQPLT